MEEPAAGRYEVVVEEGPPRGDLYELERTTRYAVVDRLTGQVVLAFEGLLEASLSTETGLWDGWRTSGVCGVELAPDGRSVVVRTCDGEEEVVALPG